MVLRPDSQPQQRLLWSQLSPQPFTYTYRGVTCTIRSRCCAMLLIYRSWKCRRSRTDDLSSSVHEADIEKISFHMCQSSPVGRGFPKKERSWTVYVASTAHWNWHFAITITFAKRLRIILIHILEVGRTSGRTPDEEREFFQIRSHLPTQSHDLFYFCPNGWTNAFAKIPNHGCYSPHIQKSSHIDANLHLLVTNCRFSNSLMLYPIHSCVLNDQTTEWPHSTAADGHRRNVSRNEIGHWAHKAG